MNGRKQTNTKTIILELNNTCVLLNEEKKKQFKYANGIFYFDCTWQYF